MCKTPQHERCSFADLQFRSLLLCKFARSFFAPDLPLCHLTDSALSCNTKYQVRTTMEAVGVGSTLTPAGLVTLRTPSPTGPFPTGATVWLRQPRQGAPVLRITTPACAAPRSARGGAERKAHVTPGDEVEVVSAGSGTTGVNFVFKCNGFSQYCTRHCGCPLPKCVALPRTVLHDKLKCHCGSTFLTVRALKQHVEAVRKRPCSCR